LKDDGGGDAIDDSPPLFPANPPLAEELLRLLGGEGFIPANDGKSKTHLQPPDEPVNLFALNPFTAVEPKGITDDDPFDAMALNQFGDHIDVRLTVLSDEGRHSHRRSAELIADGDPDSPAAVVESQCPHALFPVLKKQSLYKSSAWKSRFFSMNGSYWQPVVWRRQVFLDGLMAENKLLMRRAFNNIWKIERNGL